MSPCRTRLVSLVMLVMPTMMLVLAGCYSLTAQDKTALQTGERLTGSAYCHLDGGGASRALIRAAHAEMAGILRRNEIDAGPTDGTIDCPGP